MSVTIIIKLHQSHMFTFVILILDIPQCLTDRTIVNSLPPVYNGCLVDIETIETELIELSNKVGPPDDFPCN